MFERYVHCMNLAKFIVNIRTQLKGIEPIKPKTAKRLCSVVKLDHILKNTIRIRWRTSILTISTPSVSRSIIRTYFNCFHLRFGKYILTTQPDCFELMIHKNTR